MGYCKNLITQEVASKLKQQISELNSKLNLHMITLKDDTGVERVVLYIYSQKSEALTYDDIAAFLQNNGFIYDSSAESDAEKYTAHYPATGCMEDSLGKRTVFGIAYNANATSTDSRLIAFAYNAYAQNGGMYYKSFSTITRFSVEDYMIDVVIPLIT